MAPMGTIYFHPDGGGYCDDFSRQSLGQQAFFIHELTHVWQTQAKGRFYLILMRHPFCHYAYEFQPGRPFNRYGLEQQAEIVKDIFLASHGAPVACAPPRSLLPFGCIAGVALIEVVSGVPLNSGFYLWTAPAWLLWYLSLPSERVDAYSRTIPAQQPAA